MDKHALVRPLAILAVLMIAGLGAVACHPTTATPTLPDDTYGSEPSPSVTVPPTPTGPGPTGTTTPKPSPTPSQEISPSVDMDEIAQEHPSRVDNSTLPITPIDRLHLTGHPPEHVDIDTYILVIDGLVERSLSLTYEDILGYPERTEIALLICPTVFADNAEWTGVPLSILLTETGVKPNAQELRFSAMDGYETTLSIDDAMGEGVFLVYKINGETLPLAHGYPLRVVVKGQYGSEWVKWLTRIEAL